MEYIHFYQFLQKHVQGLSAEWKTLLSQCPLIKVEKGTLLHQRGHISFQSYYVQKGLLRYYSIDEKGKEHILQFAPESWFISDRQSGYLQQPSDFYIDALEYTEALVIDEELILKLAEENKEFLAFNNRLLQNHVRQLQNRINQLLSFTAEMRYLEFIKIYPDILARVPQAMVASYLGITPESLSRIRKDMAQRR